MILDVGTEDNIKEEIMKTQVQASKAQAGEKKGAGEAIKRILTLIIVITIARGIGYMIGSATAHQMSGSSHTTTMRVMGGADVVEAQGATGASDKQHGSSADGIWAAAEALQAALEK